METEHANYCIQCKDHISGKIGSFLFKERAGKGEFIATSLVFSDLTKLFSHMKEEGWKRDFEGAWNSIQRPIKTSSPTDERIKQTGSDFSDEGGLDTLAERLQALSKEIDSYDPKDLTESGSDEPTIDCRLRYYERSFIFLTGDSSYDQDHRGHWGASLVGPNLSFDDAKIIGTNLLEQVLDSIAESE